MVALSSSEKASMPRPRKKDPHLPACVHHHHGAYYLVKNNVWTRLGKTLPKEFQQEQKTPLARLIDAALLTIKPRVSKSTWGNYQTAARKLKHAFRDFRPEQITTADAWEFRDTYATTP